jgi:hypothetical protein
MIDIPNYFFGKANIISVLFALGFVIMKMYFLKWRLRALIYNLPTHSPRQDFIM